MKLIDTHNHLYLENFDPEQEVLVNAARESGIDTLLLPNVDVECMTYVIVFLILPIQ